jgi:hypothetical protein
MSRSGYSEDLDQGALNIYRANVDRALAGKRGQRFLREMLAALDAMPVKELVAGEIVRDETHVCAIGAVALARKVDVFALDVYDQEEVGKTFGVAKAMAAEIAYENDECGYDDERNGARRLRFARDDDDRRDAHERACGGGAGVHERPIYHGDSAATVLGPGARRSAQGMRPHRVRGGRAILQEDWQRGARSVHPLRRGVLPVRWQSRRSGHDHVRGSDEADPSRAGD